MFALRPKSTMATSGASGSAPASPTSNGAVGETASTKSWSSQRATPRARATASAASTSPGAVTRPRRQPCVRRWRARARVSIPAIAGIPSPAQERRQLARLLGDRRGRGRDDERPQPGALGLVVGADPPVVADERVGHDDDLAGVRGVGADLLVAGLAGVHDEVAAGRDVGPEGDPAEDRPVLEGQQGRPAGADAGVDDEARVRGGRQAGRHDVPIGVTPSPTRKRHRPGGRGGR